MSYGSTNTQIPEAENVIATCTLSIEPQASKMSYITPFWFFITYKRKSWQFEHDDIVNISLSHHKFVGHLTIGGLIACFSTILLSKGIFDPFILLITLIGGLILLYYGWMGAPVLIVQERNDTTKIYLGEVPAELSAYLNFYKKYRFQQKQAMHIYHIASAEDWAREDHQYTHASLQTEQFIHASTKEQVAPTFGKHFPDSGSFLLLEINTSQLESPLKYEYVETRAASFPHIFGPINKSAVEKTHAFSNLQELQSVVARL